jgi:hypothetical protein
MSAWRTWWRVAALAAGVGACAPDEPAPAVQGPLVEMEPIEFRTLQDADVRLNVRRSPTVGGGFRLTMNKRHGFWVVVDEEIEWAS